MISQQQIDIKQLGSTIEHMIKALMSIYVLLEESYLSN